MSSLSLLISQPVIKPAGGRIVKKADLSARDPRDASDNLAKRCAEVLAVLKLHGAPLDCYDLADRMQLRSVDYVRRMVRELIDAGSVREAGIVKQKIVYEAVDRPPPIG